MPRNEPSRSRFGPGSCNMPSMNQTGLCSPGGQQKHCCEEQANAAPASLPGKVQTGPVNVMGQKVTAALMDP